MVLLMELRVDIQEFEGPLDLLLQMIRKNKIAIENIPIHEITASYLQFIEDNRQKMKDTMGDFLVMAAELIYIKSRVLLPVLEEEEEEDPREDLMRRLLAYESFQRVSTQLKDLEHAHYERLVKPRSEIIFSEKAPIAISQQIELLCEAFYTLVENREERLRQKNTIDHFIEEEDYDVDECMDAILFQLNEGSKPLRHLLNNGTLPELIAFFLAALELIKQERINLALQDKEIYLSINERSAYA